MKKTYSELRRLETIEERYRYLRLGGYVGDPTFGFDRYINQGFYRSREWKLIREHIIVRDSACDLGVEGFDLFDRVYIHHMNPMTVEEIVDGDPAILDPEFLIACSMNTHNAIHYGTEQTMRGLLVERTPGDTKLW